MSSSTDTTFVYATHGGNRFHRRANCEALLSGQAKAAQRGHSTYAPKKIPLSDAEQAGRIECVACALGEAPSTPLQGPWERRLRELEPKLETPYERAFFERVLPHVKGVRPVNVDAQVEVSDFFIGQRRLDFVLQLGNGRKLAIEIDGHDKTQGVGPMVVHDDEALKTSTLGASGWLVLRFTNRQVVYDTWRCVEIVAKAAKRGDSPTAPVDAARVAPTTKERNDSPTAKEGNDSEAGRKAASAVSNDETGQRGRSGATALAGACLAGWAGTT